MFPWLIKNIQVYSPQHTLGWQASHRGFMPTSTFLADEKLAHAHINAFTCTEKMSNEVYDVHTFRQKQQKSVQTT